MEIEKIHGVFVLQLQKSSCCNSLNLINIIFRKRKICPGYQLTSSACPRIPSTSRYLNAWEAIIPDNFGEQNRLHVTAKNFSRCVIFDDYCERHRNFGLECYESVVTDSPIKMANQITRFKTAIVTAPRSSETSFPRCMQWLFRRLDMRSLMWPHIFPTLFGRPS